MAKVGWGKWIAGAVAVAAGGAAYAYIRQRQAAAAIHETLLSDGLFELRRYPKLLMAETLQHGSRDRALGNGFGLLADYMFGDGREGDAIPIVVPFFAELVTGGTWRIRFLLPPGIEPAAVPMAGDGIAIVEVPSREVAAIKIPAKLDERLLAAKEADLRAWTVARGRRPVGGVEHAYYNSPLKPGTMKSNELLIGIEAAA